MGGVHFNALIEVKSYEPADISLATVCTVGCENECMSVMSDLSVVEESSGEMELCEDEPLVVNEVLQLENEVGRRK